jgi:hypothetical protein
MDDRVGEKTGAGEAALDRQLQALGDLRQKWALLILRRRYPRKRGWRLGAHRP